MPGGNLQRFWLGWVAAGAHKINRRLGALGNHLGTQRLEVLPVLDNLERAISHAGQNEGGQGLLEGVTMTAAQFRKVIEELGARPISAVGAVFDPNLHQAMGQVETSEQPPGTVVSEFQRGYLLQDRLLRPALVMVAKAPAAPAAE